MGKAYVHIVSVALRLAKENIEQVMMETFVRRAAGLLAPLQYILLLMLIDWIDWLGLSKCLAALLLIYFLPLKMHTQNRYSVLFSLISLLSLSQLGLVLAFPSLPSLLLSC